jgi:O-antigen/teichoic acid export membrane protein
VRRLSRNLFSLFLADVMRRVLGFVSVTFLARTLGAEGFGLVSLGFAVLAYGSVLSTAGFATLGTKRIAQGESPEVAGHIIGGRFLTTLVIFSAIAGIALLAVHDSTTARLIVLFSCTLFPQIFFLDWYFQGREKLSTVAIVRTVSSVLYLAAILLFIRSSNDALWVAAGIILGDSAAALWLFLAFRKANPSSRIRISPSLSLLKSSLPLAVGVILATLTINFPPLILGAVRTNTEVGIYSAASKLVFFLLVGDRILFSLLLPASARKQTESMNAFTLVLQDALRWILLLGVPVAIGGTLLGEKLIVLVFGFDYAGAGVVFCVFIWYFFLTMVHTVFTAGLVSAGKEKPYGKNMLITAVACGICVTLGAIRYGALGAAGGVVVSEGFSLYLMHRSLAAAVPLKLPETTFRIFLSAALMALCVFGLRNENLWLTIPAGAGCYGIFLVLFRALTAGDVKSLLARF